MKKNQTIVIMVLFSVAAHALEPRLIYPTLSPDDSVVADIVITDAPYKVDSSGQNDATAVVQEAINDLRKAGGGLLYFPAGKYRFNGQLKIPGGIALRGDWMNPLEGGSGKGTIFMVYGGRNETDVNSAFLFFQSGASTVTDVSFWYPEQTLDNVVPYPPTIARTFIPVIIQRITFFNSYVGYTTINSGGCPLFFRIFGTFLKTGIRHDKCHEYGYFERIHISPSIWADAPGDVITNAPDKETLTAYCSQATTGLLLLKNDNIQLYDITVEDALYGIHYTREETAPNPMAEVTYGFKMKIKATENIEYQSTWVGGMTDVDRFPESRNWSYIWAPLRGPARKDVFFNVRKAPYNAKADGTTDDTAAIQRALDAAGDKGGGIVYLPGAEYLVKKSIVVPEGVELRGGYNHPHHDGNTLAGLVTALFAVAGENSKALQDEDPFITLKANSGVRGITILYPNQSHFYPDATAAPAKTYPPTIRGEGKNVYVEYVTIKRAWDGIDFFSHDCSGFVIKDYFASALNRGIAIGGGTRTGWIEHSLQTKGIWGYPGLSAPAEALSNEESHNRMKHAMGNVFTGNAKAYIIGDARNIEAMGALSFSYRNHLLLEQQGDREPENLSFYMSHSENVGDTGILLTAGDNIRIFGTGIVPMSGIFIKTTESFKGKADVYGLTTWGPVGGLPEITGGTLNIHPLAPEGTTEIFAAPDVSAGIIKRTNFHKNPTFDTTTTMNGRTCWKVGHWPGNKALFPLDFFVDYQQFRFGNPGKLEMTIDYLDNGHGEMSFLYNSTEEDEKELTVKLNDSGEWKTWTCVLDDAEFKRAMKTINRNTDFQIQITSGKQAYVSKVCLRRTGS